VWPDEGPISQRTRAPRPGAEVILRDRTVGNRA
jgi:hypothetical protein